MYLTRSELLARIVVLNFCRSRDDYFLWVKFRIDTIKEANARMIINSSYVLISATPFFYLEAGGKYVPPAAWFNILARIFRFMQLKLNREN